MLFKIYSLQYRMWQIYEESATFEIGKGNILKKGSNILLITSGALCADALDVDLMIQEAFWKKLLVTYVNHSIIGGLGCAIAEVIAVHNIDIRLLRHGVMDQFGKVILLNS